ncbi:MAG TPA: AsmA family protein [Kineobactrum sp.]
MTDLHLQLRAFEGVLTLDTVTGGLHGGQLDATGTLNARRAIAQLDTRGTFNGLDTAQLLATLNADPILTGTASTSWALTSSGRTRNELVQGLLGELQLTTAAIVLEQMGIERMLCEVVAQINQQPLQAELPSRSEFETLTATIRLGEGEALLAPLRAELAHIALRGEGRLDLATTDFQADFRAQLGSGLAEVDPACRVNERITSIEWPVVCKGELGGEPGDWCRVDSREILQALAKGELERKVKKEGGKLLQRLLERTQPKEEAQ